MVWATSFFAIIPLLERTFSVDSMYVSLSDLEDFAEGSAADELEKVKIARGEWDFGGWRLFVGGIGGSLRLGV